MNGVKKFGVCRIKPVGLQDVDHVDAFCDATDLDRVDIDAAIVNSR